MAFSSEGSASAAGQLVPLGGGGGAAAVRPWVWKTEAGAGAWSASEFPSRIPSSSSPSSRALKALGYCWEALDFSTPITKNDVDCAAAVRAAAASGSVTVKVWTPPVRLKDPALTVASV